MIINGNLYGIVANKPVESRKNTTNPLKVYASSLTAPAYAPIPVSALRAYSNISFSRSFEEHKSWGANLNKDGTANFKVFTFPTSQKVYIEFMPEDNMTNFNNVDARDIIVDRDASGRVTDIKPKDSKSKIVELDKKGGGVFEISNVDGVKDNDRYRLLIVKGDNVIEKVKDPYAKKQTHVMGWSSIYDSDKYQWKNTDWIDGKVPSRVSRQKGKGLRNIGSLRIMEINIPTFTEEGDFAAAKDYVRRIALNNLANTVEIMPTDGANGKGWTYDGVDKFAVSEKNGGPDKLKELIDYIHKYKLNVIMDIVPNHMGPDGDMLARTGPYERGPGGFGSLYNYEGDSNRYVRDYIVNMALHWAGEYKVDGLRLDMTKPMYMGSDFTLKQIATEVNEHYPDVFLIAEDGEGNRAKITTPRQGLGSHEADVNNIDRQVDKVAKHQGIERLDDIGFDSEWDFPLFHELNEVIMGGGDLYKLDAAIRGSNKRVSYIMSHDEIGNMDGTRLITKIVTQRLGLFYHMEGNTPAEIGQRSAHATQKILEKLVTGQMDVMEDSQWAEFLKSNKITRFIPKDEVKNVFKTALAEHRLALGTLYSYPGPKMVFQFDEMGGLNYFKFFRQFSDTQTISERIKDPAQADKVIEEVKQNRENARREKGYYPDLSAYHDSKPNRIKYNAIAKLTLQKTERFSRDLNRLFDRNEALQGGTVRNTIIHPMSRVHAMHVVKGKDEVFSVKNFSDASYNANYGITLPKGKWEEVINSNDKQYAGTGICMNEKTIKDPNNAKKRIKEKIVFNSDGKTNTQISLPANSIVYFQRVG